MRSINTFLPLPQNDLDPEEAEAKYKEIQEAYEIMTTPEKKMLFDSDPKNLVKPPHPLTNSLL